MSRPGGKLPPPQKKQLFLKSEGKEFRKKNKMKMDVGEDCEFF